MGWDGEWGQGWDGDLGSGRQGMGWRTGTGMEIWGMGNRGEWEMERRKYLMGNGGRDGGWGLGGMGEGMETGNGERRWGWDGDIGNWKIGDGEWDQGMVWNWGMENWDRDENQIWGIGGKRWDQRIRRDGDMEYGRWGMGNRGGMGGGVMWNCDGVKIRYGKWE